MTFEEVLNNRPTAYNFSREKWNKVSDVDAFVASLKEAHEQEVAQLREAHAHTVEKMQKALAMQADREIHERVKRSSAFLQVAENARAWLDRLIVMADPRGDVKRYLTRVGEENRLNFMHELINGSLGVAFTDDEVHDMLESLRKQGEADGKEYTR